MAAKKQKAKKTKPKLSADEKKKRKLQAAHKRSARAIFRNMGFGRAREIAEKEIVFEGQAGEFDDAFVYENLIVLMEYTISKSSDVTDHVKKKSLLYSKIQKAQKDFILYLRKHFLEFDSRLGSVIHEDKYILKIVYCSFNEIGNSIKSNVPYPIYMDFPYLKYFEKISAAIKASARHEFFAFLRVDPSDIARDGTFSKLPASVTYDGSLLPESSSGFPAGFKVVSFYADAASLLNRAYVLRRDGWRGSFQAYQRMLQPSKIEGIRKKLKVDRQVFVNNLITTLPDDVHPIDEKGKTVDVSTLIEIEPIRLSLPLKANSICLIDGQHRLFSYYESVEDDAEIAKLRHQQNLLVTGIMYPENVKRPERERFEAALFLAINTKQTVAEAALRQEIEVLLTPFSPTAIGKQVMQKLAESGPLVDQVMTYFFDKGKLKTASIVSYGLGPLIKLTGNDSLFCLFEHPQKDKIADGRSQEGLDAYIKFAVAKINIFLNAVRVNVDPDRWTPDASVKDRLLTVTYINSFLITMRLLIEFNQKIEFEHLKEKLRGVGSFQFKNFHSSQYNRMAETIFEKYFK